MKDNKSEQQSSDEGEHASPSQDALASSCEEGHYLSQYYSLLNLQQRGDYHEIIIQSQLVRELQGEQINYHPEKFQPELAIEIQEKTANFQAIQLSVAYGHFNTKINLINVYAKSPVEVLNQSFSGSFGVVYKSTINDRPIAIKTAKIFPNKFQSTFRQIIKEYFLLKIAAALKIGPKIIKNFGFDIVVFKDSFAFSMEFCQMNNYKLNASFELLRRKLHLLHVLRLVHLDLKPENIAFSPALDEYVFIDFGLSRAVCEPIGSKTLVSFTGSFNYCCPQMLELYLKDELGYINLYYNDAFCLERSMKYLNELQVQLTEEMLFANRPNLQQLTDCETLLKIKLTLFEYSIYFTTSTDILVNNQKYIKKKLIELNNYAIMLPQSLTFINLTRKYLKIGTNVEEYGSMAKDETIRKEARVYDEAMQLFSSRFYMIENYQSNQHNQQLSPSLQCPYVFLHDEQSAKNTRMGLLKLTFITYIRLNSNEQHFQSKISACRIFSEVHLKIVQEITQIQLYRACVNFVFLSALNFADPEDWLTLSRALETVTILEIVSEEQLLKAFTLTINQPLEYFDKMSILFEFINSAEYINQKYKTKYKYQRLIVQMMTALDKYLDSIAMQLKKDEEKEIFMGMKNIICKKIPCSFPISYEYCTKRIKDQSIDWKILHQTILYHSISNELMRLIDIHGHFSDSVFKLILIYLNSTNYYYPRLTYCHFVIYTVTFICNKTSLNRAIYSLFYQQLKQFQEHKHFKVYLLNKLTTIKEQQSKALLLLRYQITPNLSLERQQVQLQEIFDILNYIIEEGEQFQSEIGYIFNISNILEKPYLINLINRLIDRNKEKVFKLSHKLHQEGPLLHNNKLRKEIIAKNNIFEFIGKKRQQEEYCELASTFMLQCQELISTSNCFQCKLFSYLQLKLIQANILASQNLIEESFLLVLDIFIVYIKNTQYFKNAFSILICLLKQWRISNCLYKKFDLQGFLYQFVGENENYQHCLIDIRQYNLFLSLYLYIAMMRTDQEMVKFILNMITILLQKKSISFVNNFYYSIVYIIKINKGNDLRQLKMYHDRIVDKILMIPNLLDYKFIALYFSALLQVQIRASLQSKMLQTISFLLNSIDPYTKSIILNRYYYNIAFYILSSHRKQSNLCLKHIKYCQESFTLKFIFRRKLKHWSRCVRQRFTIKMKNYIERYHYNIGNIH